LTDLAWKAAIARRPPSSPSLLGLTKPQLDRSSFELLDDVLHLVPLDALPLDGLEPPPAKGESPRRERGPLESVGDRWRVHVRASAVELAGSEPPRAGSAALVALLAGLTWHQQKDYRNLETLWLRTLEKNPCAWIAEFNLGTAAAQRGEYEEALRRLRTATELRPEEYNGWYNAGSVLNTLQRYEEALPYLQRATALAAPRALVELLERRRRVLTVETSERHDRLVRRELEHRSGARPDGRGRPGLCCSTVGSYQRHLCARPESSFVPRLRASVAVGWRAIRTVRSGSIP
jgi:tetratricopeptide (TPR) repeat protein